MKEITYERPGHLSLLTSMREQDQLCDVTIQVDGQRFRAHKNILAATIPYFQGMFLTGFQESNMDMIPINNITASNMDTLIAFAYTGKITITDDNVESLIKDFDYLQLTDIKQECEKFLLLNLRVENVRRIYHIADVLSCSPLKEVTYEFLCHNIHNIVHTDDFLDFEFSLLTDVLIVNDLRYAIFSKSELFEIIMKWLTNNFNDRKIHLPELRRCVKFSAFTITDLRNYICKDEVVAKFSEFELRDIVADLFLHQRSEKQEVKNDDVDNRWLNQAKGRIVVVDRFKPKSIEIYDPCTGVWESIPINEPFHIGHGTVHEGRLYFSTNNAVRFYEFKDKRWGEIPLVNSDYNLNIVAGLNGYLYMHFSEGFAAKNKLSRFFLRTQHFVDLSPMYVARYDVTLITFRRYIYAIGGRCNFGRSLNFVERYDPEADRWRTLPGIPTSRYGAAAAVLNEKIYVCGGFGGDLFLNSVEFFDPETNRWENAAPMNEARSDFVVVALAGKLWALGGRYHQSVEMYDPDKDTWSLICSAKNNGSVVGGVLFNEC